MSAIKIGIVGVGKIARDQHIPTIAANPDFELVAVASLSQAEVPGAKSYRTVDEMLAGSPELDAVALCTPPQVRRDAAVAAMKVGKHVLLEKPPAQTLGEVAAMSDAAKAAGVSLFATWHSRFAAGVEPAREWLAKRAIRKVEIAWKEDVRRWHPGQAWIWQGGGMGVFDPGINALSILTRILPERPFLLSAELETPANREMPIAAHLTLTTGSGLAVDAVFDWRQTGPQTWDVRIETDDGLLQLHMGGSQLEIDGKQVVDEEDVEYAGIYRRFAELIRARQSDVDVSPLGIVADAFLCGRRKLVEAFED